MNSRLWGRREWLLALIATMTCAPRLGRAGEVTADERRERIQAREKSPPTEALARKARSEALLKKHRVPVNANLPVIETAAEVSARDTATIARRALCLLVVALKGEGLEAEFVDKWKTAHDLSAHFTPLEKAFLSNPSPSAQDLATFSWRYEAAWVLLWSLGHASTLGLPTAMGDTPASVKLLTTRTTARIIADARPRAIDEVLDQADLIYRCHWAVVEARLNQEPPPADLNPDVVVERHWALNWLIGYMGQDWDHISTDT